MPHQDDQPPRARPLATPLTHPALTACDVNVTDTAHKLLSCYCFFERLSFGTDDDGDRFRLGPSSRHIHTAHDFAEMKNMKILHSAVSKTRERVLRTRPRRPEYSPWPEHYPARPKQRCNPGWPGPARPGLAWPGLARCAQSTRPKSDTSKVIDRTRIAHKRTDIGGTSVAWRRGRNDPAPGRSKVYRCVHNLCRASSATRYWY